MLGLDRFSIPLASRKFQWRRWGSEEEFTAFDRGALAFVYRASEIKPPASLHDLLDKRFLESISLEDPGTSSPGLQFFFWVLDAMGVDPGFEFLASLKPNLQAVSPSWSSAYGLFTKKQSKLVFSYFTSPVYHWIEEKNHDYQPAVFSEGQPVQEEFAGIPQVCANCEWAHRFVQFLRRPEIQKQIMLKNFMMPVISGVEKGTEFENLPPHHEYQWKNLPYLLEHRDELLNRWRELSL